MNKGTRVSTAGSLSDKEATAAFSFAGSFNSDVFSIFIRQFPLPFLCPGKADVMDNSSVRKVKHIIGIIKNTGAEVIFLPPYSPEPDPVEPVWPKLKDSVKKSKPRTAENLYDVLKKAPDIITGDNIKNFFNYCGIFSTCN